jgi:hypothetical protein
MKKLNCKRCAAENEERIKAGLEPRDIPQHAQSDHLNRWETR